MREEMAHVNVAAVRYRAHAAEAFVHAAALAEEQRSATDEHLEEIEEELDEEFDSADKERDQIIDMLTELKKDIAALKAEKSD